MRLHQSRTTDRTRTARGRRLEVEACESRRLMSGATISGTTFQDLAGGGDSPLARLANVTMDLYRSGSSAVYEHTLSNASGDYEFTNLAPGNYSVQQVIPAHFLPTGELFGYPVTVSGNQVAPEKDFDDFDIIPLPVLGNPSFTVTTPAGHAKTLSTLDGNVQEGDTVTAKFNLETTGQITLVAYKAPNGDFGATSNYQKQVIFGEAGAKGTGAQTLTVKVPNGYFQLDFVGGMAIDDLDINSNVMYHAQDRFIAGATGGNQVAPSAVVVQSPSTVVPLTTDLVTPSDPLQRKH